MGFSIAQEPFNYNEVIPGSWDDHNFDRACQIWSLAPQEILQLRELQGRLSDLSYWKNEPHHVLWFMKGPLGFSTNAVEHHFRKMVQWRIENDIDGLPDRYEPRSLHLQNTVCSILNDEDRDGDPIYVERGGAINPVSVLKQSSKEEMIEYAVWVRELHMRGAWKDEYERRHGHPVKNITIIYDLKGLSRGHLDPRVIGVFKDVIKLTKECYSAPVKRMIIIRAPALFRVGWAIVKHIFPPSARKKMIFAGTENYLDVLEKYVDLDVLPRCINPMGHGCTRPGLPKVIGEAESEMKSMDDLCAEASQSTFTYSEASEAETSSDPQVEVFCKKILSGGWEQQQDDEELSWTPTLPTPVLAESSWPLPGAQHPMNPVHVPVHLTSGLGMHHWQSHLYQQSHPGLPASSFE